MGDVMHGGRFSSLVVEVAALAMRYEVLGEAASMEWMTGKEDVVAFLPLGTTEPTTSPGTSEDAGRREEERMEVLRRRS
ncbi:unnamed protein product [Hydatigera taeniaeformis]|uniref:Uncharacterized protein n=1 Tax=Hydatigena taeniaeformis TaxID=6205 RepID=A0A0R3X600_HYDTA|nr:unnamed protein product [Hydatigera taeniaeformis]